MEPIELEQYLNQLNENSSLKQIQQYANLTIKTRGFEDESPRDIMLLLTEEIGELAKEIRKTSNLKLDYKKNTAIDVEGEIADVFNYILALCKAMDVDLLKAFKKKEQINCHRTWK